MSKIRVHALAKELNLSSKDLLQKMAELNIDVKNHMSTLEPEDEKKIRNAYHTKSEEQKNTQNKNSVVNDEVNNSDTKNKHIKNNKDSKGKSGQQQLNKNFDNKKNKDTEKNKEFKSDKNFSKKHNTKENFKSEEISIGKNKKKKHQHNKIDMGELNESGNRRKQRDLTKKTPVKKRSKAQKKQDKIDAIKSDDSPIKIKAPITVKEFAEKLFLPVTQIISKLIVLGIMASQNQEIDEDTCILVADELGVEIVIEEPEQEISIEEKLGLDYEDSEKDLKTRPPVVTVMGHVDHGKTSILDVIKKSHVQESEAGGITQHIGAYTVTVNKKKITFLDTPGHEAFTSMRLRGALITDIAILVVAADDGVMPQTIEAISHAKSANVPIIVAINKIDKPSSNIDRVKQELLENGLMSEDWGGDTIMVPVSAKTKEGIDDLLEMINLVAEMQELKANPNRMAVGTVIEAKLDKGKGPMATVLVQKGTLNFGDTVVSGVASGRIRAMTDDKNRNIKKAGPSMPAVILGLSDVPNAGELIYAVEDEKTARTIADSNREELRENRINSGSKVSLDNLFDRIKEGEMKDLNIVVKADVKGSVEALIQSLLKLSNEEVKINVIHSGVGGINESDVTLASASNAIVVGFNVRPNINAIELSKNEEVDVRTYRVIYDIIDDVEKAVKGMLDPDIVEEVMGRCEVRQTFKLPGNIIVAGIYVLSGKIVRNAKIRVLREDVVIHEGEVASLKRFKDDVKELNTSFEGGLGIEGFNDVKDGDLIECYIMKEVKRD
ncbi:translation initiation factor IF-2 [Peptoniphilus indolicus]|uniref:Translation initiation factor IF-2 n=1 Tax=Peptoniphilus indolicus TaxID=33030 RepID=A0A379DEX4_9FIRM|nr:translation initiation factor IF-2 [Peptoniphilus indolicus]SUB76112.1 Translation initiation factor IF-2 [Peptoniphilus indolicus]